MTGSSGVLSLGTEWRARAFSKYKLEFCRLCSQSQSSVDSRSLDDVFSMLEGNGRDAVFEGATPSRDSATSF